MAVILGAKAAVIGSCLAIFWPGAFIFGFPGVMAHHWELAFHMSRGAVARTLFFALTAVGLSMGQAVLILTAFNFANGASRLVSGYLYDVIGRNTTLSFAFLASGCAGRSLALLDYFRCRDRLCFRYPLRRFSTFGE